MKIHASHKVFIRSCTFLFGDQICLYWDFRQRRRGRYFCVNQEERKIRIPTNLVYLLDSTHFRTFFLPLLGIDFEPLKPPLENLWFVSFWWPLATIFETDSHTHFRVLAHKATDPFFENISQELNDLFPIISSLAIYGSFLHLIGDLFLLYQNPWLLFFATLSVHWFVLWLTLLLRIYSSLVPLFVLVIFSFFYLTTTQPLILLLLTLGAATAHGLYVRGGKIEASRSQEEMKNSYTPAKTIHHKLETTHQ